MRVITHLLQPYIWKFAVIYFDDILVYSKNREEHLTHLHSICQLLRRESIYINLKKCTFMSNSVIFLGFIMSTEGIKMDPEKVKAILDWPLPTTITEVRNFHGLATFYRRFIRNFSGITAPITDCLKKSEFKWTNAATRAFEQIKQKITEAPIPRVPDFEKVFEVACDASNVGIGSVLSQEGHPIAFHSETLSDSKCKYSPYALEFYALVQSIHHWRHYLIGREFVLYSDHESLKHLQSQHKMGANFAKWSTYIQEFTFTSRHKSGKENGIADVLSRRIHLLTTMAISVPGFEQIKEAYLTKTSVPSIKRSFGVILSCIHTLAFMMDICSMVVAFVCQIHLFESMLLGNYIPEDAADI
ncbi:hypothetical protein AAC387_Pa07g1707 [Persea americana]